MPDQTITTDTGTTVTIAHKDGDTIVVLDHPDAPADMRHKEVGRILDGGFQPHPFATWGAMPATLRAIADLIEAVGNA